eukprot:CAMPEP_0185739820 /NCGR_PEP_ID=MMETSP1171-20130828/36311_1 /TAXON_ID=374046 /ORGANISM="Helicotheca tamensis, Strain CCMP826" /LENGTH=707 /DNA_ID=CAMNT_0028411483 /DNA_START=269 /DNA_END=2392 /DNA_ORIENTATION=+
MDENPLLGDWSTEPFNLPPFDRIQPNHFPPAFEECMKRHIDDLQAIVDNTDDPTFENVLVPYDQAGSLLSRTGAVFYNMCSSLNTDDMKEVQMSMVPILSRHRSATYTLPGLFEKLQAVYDNRLDAEAKLTEEQVRLVERVHMDFTRAGASFGEEQKKEYAELLAELASLQTEFQQNVMKDEETYEMKLKEEDLEGCPDSLVEAAKQVAAERGYNKEDSSEEDTYIITLSRSLVEPFLTFSSRRDLRQEAWKAWTSRGELDPTRDNLSIARNILLLRKKQANMHGYDTFAEYQCVDRMAKTPQNVMDLLENVWGRAKVCADKERTELEEYAKKIGEDVDGGIKPWDWRYYAEKVRVEKYDLDEAIVKPYFSLNKVTDALFAVSNKLFGLTYTKRSDLKVYHPDVVAYEVRRGDDLQAIFLHDNFARPFKSSGAWMSEYRSQTKNLPSSADSIESIPIVANNNNFAKGGDSESENTPTLLSFDDAKTLFHEMGHGHHGILSDATYSRLSSTSVLMDFVELPSQLMEHWFDEPEILKEYARHFETGEPIPDELLAKIQAAKSFQEGFRTIEYTSCALIDMALHSLSDYPDDFDMTKFEEEELGRLGMPAGIVMRHRPAHFSHLFSTSAYAAGYYVYLWAEVLDADVYAAFRESGNVFDSETAEKARKFIYSAGNTVAPDELFRKFRGRDPDISFMLEKKGLASADAPAS